MSNSIRDTSQYMSTAVKGWYLDLWIPRYIPKNEFDELIEIPAKYDQRPDLLSNEKYGTPGLWWVFAVRNPDKLIDPINDFTAGLEIYVPINILKR